jgi:predicted RNA-binding protein YlxR (DUF448 family)
MPRRRCVGCGRIAPKSELLRIAAAAGGDGGARPRRAVADRDARMPGRGAYLCLGESPGLPAGDCLALAMRRGGIARALRCSVTVDPKLVESVS